MKRQILFQIVALLAGGVAACAGAPGDSPTPSIAPSPLAGEAASRNAVAGTLKGINKFPELYTRGPVELRAVVLDGDVRKDMGFYCVGIMLKGGSRDRKAIDQGEYSAPFLSMDRTTFVLPDEIARDLAGAGKNGRVDQATLRFVVERTSQLGNVFWVAKIFSVDLYGPGGNLVRTIAIPRPPGAETPSLSSEAAAAPALAETPRGTAPPELQPKAETPGAGAEKTE